MSAPANRHIVVVVGTDHHPFDRAVAWADDWQRRHPEDRVVIQFGRSRPPELASGHDFLAPEEVRDGMAAADVVITHGGPGTISDAQRSGHRPIVFPRDPARGEHVDDHQLRFAAWCAERDLVGLAREVDDLERLLAEAADTRAATADTARSRASVATFAELVGRRHVIGARPASAARLLLVLDNGSLPDGVDLGRLPTPATGLAVLARRRLRRSERAPVLDYCRGIRESVAVSAGQGAGGRLPIGGGGRRRPAHRARPRPRPAARRRRARPWPRACGPAGAAPRAGAGGQPAGAALTERPRPRRRTTARSSATRSRCRNRCTRPT